MSSGQKRYSIVWADDHEVVRAALRRAFETPGLVEAEGLDVVAEAMTGREALAAVKRYKPSLVTLDVSMPDIGGHEVIRELRRWSPQTRIVVFTGVTAPGLISSLVQSGAEGLFSKSGTGQTMLDKLPHILRGGRFVDERFLRILENEPNTPALTVREHQVLNLLVSGRSNREISEVLGISSKTVEKHRGSLMGKVQVSIVP